MDILSLVVYVVLFIILMIFVFSIGMLRPFMPKKEMALVIVCGFIIGALGGAFFLSPIYEELPQVVSTVEKLVPSNEEVVYLDVSSSMDINELENNLTHTDGVKSVDVTGIGFNLWTLDNREQSFIESSMGNIDSHYVNWTVNSSGKVDVVLEKGSDVSSALKSFSDWFKLNYDSRINYATIHMKVVVQSSQLDNLESNLLKREIVPLKVEGPVQDSINQTNESMLSINQFILVSGGFGVVVSLFGIYYDSIVVKFRKFKKFVSTKILKRR